MKLLLLQPSRTAPLGSNVPSWVELDTGAYPPLGILYLASAARLWTDCEVTVIDAQGAGISYDELARRLVREQPDVVGITALSFSMLDVVRSARVVRL